MTSPTPPLGQDGGVPTTSSPVSGDAPPRRVDGSMSLLVDMMTNTLDSAYAERAARRNDPGSAPAGGTGPVPRTVRGTAPPLLAILLVGVLTGTAVAQVRERQEAGTGLRAELVEEVRERTGESEALAGRAEDLRSEVDAARQASLGAGAAGQALTDRLAALGLASATTPVEGPGIVVTLDDAPSEAPLDPTDPRAATGGEGRVQDRDLQDAVNGLWAAGAEAISINGERLTVLTAKRSAGGAILVDLRPLSPPYVVEAVGDPSALELGFLDGPAGRRLTTYTSLYGFGLDVRRADQLSLPGAAVPDLRSSSREGSS